MADMEKRKISELSEILSVSPNTPAYIEVSEAQNNGQSYESKQMSLETLRNYIFLKAFPIGSIYMTTTNLDNPGKIFGGDWERYAEGRTIFGVDGSLDKKDDRYQIWGKPNVAGGAETMTLDTNTMPQHRHNVAINTKMNSGAIEFSVRHPYDPNGVSGSYTSSIHFSNGNKGVVKEYQSSHPWNTGTVSKSQPTVEARKGDKVTINLPGIQTETTVQDNPIDPSQTNEISLYPPYVTCYIWRRIG